jgi:putative transposase
MRGFPHSDEPEETMMGELWVGVTLSGWSPVMRIPMKGIPRAVKPREEGLISSYIKPNETRTPN